MGERACGPSARSPRVAPSRNAAHGGQRVPYSFHDELDPPPTNFVVGAQFGTNGVLRTPAAFEIRWKNTTGLDLAKKYTFPGTPLFVPGMPFSKVALARYATSPAPDSEAVADGILWIDNATGAIVPEPDKAWQPISDAELLESALSDFDDDAVKAYHMTLRKEIEQVPGWAVVTFRGEPSHETEYGYVLAPDFILRVWINTRTKTVYHGEIGN